jgi:hypothetical protein
MTHEVLCNVPVLLFLQVILQEGWDFSKIEKKRDSVTHCHGI